MALTITIGNEDFNVAGNKRRHTAQIAFDSSYPWGGESLTAANLGLTGIDQIQIFPQNGYFFEFDYTNNKVKVFSNAPPIVYEEKHVAVAKAVTLDYPAAWIINVCTTGQNEAWVKRGATLSDNQFKLSAAIADGARTGISTFGATDTIYVTYVTQAWKELYDLLVQEEAVTLATGNNNLANKMAAFGHCDAATSGVLLPVDVADTTASGEVGIKFNAATAQLNVHSDENGQAAVCTYLKTPSDNTWLADHWVYDEDPAKAGSDPYTQSFNRPLLVWGISGALTVNGGATQVIIDESTTAAAGEATHAWGKSHLDVLATVGVAPVDGHVWGCKSNVTVTAGNYIFGYAWEIPNLVPLEVKDATDLSGLTGVRLEAIGY